MKRKRTWTILLVVSALLAVGICAVMDIILIPKIELHTEGLRVFDLNAFGYSFKQAKRFVSLLHPEEKALFLYRELPLDFLCPLCYGSFFYLALRRLSESKLLRIIPPMIVMLADYCENICTLRMLTADFTPITSTIGSTCTILKSISITATLALLLILWVYGILKRRKDTAS